MIVEDVSGRCLAMAYRSYSFIDGWKLEDSASLGSYGVHGVVDWMYNSVSLLRQTANIVCNRFRIQEYMNKPHSRTCSE